MSRDQWTRIGAMAVLAAIVVLRNENGFAMATALGIALIATAAVRMPGAREQLILIGFLLPASSILVGVMLPVVTWLSPATIDGQMAVLDQGLSAEFWRWTVAHAACYDALATAYLGLPVILACSAIWSENRMGLIKALILASAVAPLTYLAFPAVGPAHVGDPLAPRNCFPSMHVTWAILCAVYFHPRYRWIGVIGLVLTITATIGLGEHYLIDDVVAFPFALVFCWAEVREMATGNRLAGGGRIIYVG